MTPVNAHALACPGSKTGFVKQRRPQHVLPISILADISILVKRTQDSMNCTFVQIELICPSVRAEFVIVKQFSMLIAR